MHPRLDHHTSIKSLYQRHAIVRVAEPLPDVEDGVVKMARCFLVRHHRIHMHVSSCNDTHSSFASYTHSSSAALRARCEVPPSGRGGAPLPDTQSRMLISPMRDLILYHSSQ